MSLKLPPISYKIHPKMQEVMQEKRKRREILQQTRKKQYQEQKYLKRDRKQYMEQNKQQIQIKKQGIYQRKLSQRNKIRQQQKQRQIRIAIKKSQRLARLLPERRMLIQQLRNSYVDFIKEKDKNKQSKMQEIIQKKLEEANQEYSKIVPLEEKIKEENILDINEGLCILCLTEKAEIYMTQCKHLISCPQCQFILRMQKKCPICRKAGPYINLKDDKNKKKKRNSSIKKNK